MAAVKMNVLHWHLSEDQGFRVESKVYPLLHQTGVGRPVLHAGAGARHRPLRGRPGHSRRARVRHARRTRRPGSSATPSLSAGKGPFEHRAHVGRDATRCSTRRTRRSTPSSSRFIGEMAALFPDAYFHIGGDEVNGKQWNASPAVAAFKKRHGMTTNEDLQAYFNTRVAAMLKSRGKIMVGWDEVLHKDLPKNTVVQSWRGQKSLADAARAQGYRGILSNGYYLDYIWTAGAALRRRPDGEGRGEPAGRGEGAHPGRRGVHVGGVGDARDHRLAHLAAHGGDRGALLVSGDGAPTWPTCTGASRCVEPAPRRDRHRPTAPITSPCSSGWPTDRSDRRAEGHGGPGRAREGLQPRPPREVHEPDAAQPRRGRRASGERRGAGRSRRLVDGLLGDPCREAPAAMRSWRMPPSSGRTIARDVQQRCWTRRCCRRRRRSASTSRSCRRVGLRALEALQKKTPLVLTAGGNRGPGESRGSGRRRGPDGDAARSRSWWRRRRGQ